MEVIHTIHIRTRFMGPTNHRGSRVKAVASSGASLVVDWDHALNVSDNHQTAFRALLAKLERAPAGTVYAADPFDDGYAFMCPTT